ncbi:MAG: hypothetical protein AUJ04_05820 [Acidobacteria bacterium 13_1_40CM_3_55_6]|nr:MAG: hypothetical protein AUJ04_05820 [Acidobacteria bacterium 13_1_40CM_3_55_6]
MAEKTFRQTKSIDSDIHERLWRARRFIDDYYDLPLNLSEISRQACLSRYHFLRLFRETFQTTPHQYLIQRRIAKAKELLRSKPVSVTDVCFEVGFQSLGSFSSLFAFPQVRGGRAGQIPQARKGLVAKSAGVLHSDVWAGFKCPISFSLSLSWKGSPV